MRWKAMKKSGTTGLPCDNEYARRRPEDYGGRGGKYINFIAITCEENDQAGRSSTAYKL
jgi:hypothetical protein